jgi:hypothetical protein
MRLNPQNNGDNMLKKFISAAVCLAALTVLVGCLSASVQNDVSGLTVYGGCENRAGIFSRLPVDLHGKVPEKLWKLGKDSAGLYCCFETDASEIKVQYQLGKALAMSHMPATGVSGFDLYQEINGSLEFVKNSKPWTKAGSFSYKNSLEGSSRYVLYFPLYNSVDKLKVSGLNSRGQGVVLNNIDYFGVEKALPVLLYGTSISQGACASRPGLSYSNMLMRRMDYPVLNMGFSGSCLMEPAMCGFLSTIPSQVFIIDSLWNMNRFSSDDIINRTLNCVRTYKASNPDTPVLLVGQYIFNGELLTASEKALKDAFNVLEKEFGDIYFLPGKMFTNFGSDSVVDGVHPNDLGMAEVSSVIKNFLIETKLVSESL